VVAVERACDVLLAVSSNAGTPMGVKEVSEAVQLSMSTVHRLLVSMVKKGLMQQDDETKKYRIGRELLDFTLGYLRRLDLPEIARPHMRRLRDVTAETVSLSLLDGWSRIYLAQVESVHEIRQTVEIGKRMPLHLGGSGKAILAFLPESEREAYLAQPALAHAVDGPVDVARLRGELAEVRARGFASSRSERLPGAASVAAPIRNYAGVVVGCLSVSGPVWRFTDDRIARYGALVIRAAAEVSRSLGLREEGAASHAQRLESAALESRPCRDTSDRAN
jgi:DNA-binding IclR family transcriptional regulator